MTTMTRETSIKCGSCRERHSSAAEVKACYAKARQDSEDFNRQWAAQKNEFARHEQAQEELAFASDPDFRAGRYLPKRDEQSVANVLLQEAAKRTPYPSVKAGHYAVPSKTGNNDLDFYRVDRPTEGRWKGYTFVKVVIGGHPDYAVRGPKAKEVLDRILAEGEEKAAKRYGQEIGRCHHCNRHLTDYLSRQRGSGPDCFAQYGW